MSLSMEERLKRRKLDALKRGVHRVSGGEALSMATHVVGIGRAGAGVIAETLRKLEPTSPKLNALAIDIGDQDFAKLRSLAQRIPPERAALTIVALDVPTLDCLLSVLRQYPRFLSLEYPHYSHNPMHAAWLPDSVCLPKAGSHFKRAVAKAIYGMAYYSEPRLLETVLRDFAASVDAANAQSVVAIVFGLGGGTGSGIAADLARHLSNRMFGRRVLVAGIGIAPCDGDPPEHTGSHLFPVLNELDCMGDDRKNRGVVQSCGELFRNPYTAGFIMVPQQHMWKASGDLAATHQRGNSEIASLLTIKGGANLWELLRLLNWVAAPSTQHSAARTPWGPKWIHMLGYADFAGQPITIGSDLPTQLGVKASFTPEFIEMRVPDTTDANAAAAASMLEEAFAPDVPPSTVGEGRETSIQFILPCMSKLDLALFYESRAAYEAKPSNERLLDHSLLLDQGVLLCEPSTCMAGMAGESLWGGNAWIAVPMVDLQGTMCHAT
jgi:hypothetical protein